MVALRVPESEVADEVDEHVLAKVPANLRQSAKVFVYVSSAVEDAAAVPKSKAIVLALTVACKF